VSSDELLRTLCHKALANTVTKYQWRGRWDEVELVEEILAETKKRQQGLQKPVEAIVKDATTFCYCRRWHQACSAAGTFDQHEAFAALSEYTYRIVLPEVNGDAAIAQEISQEALLSIWKSLHTVREPGAFLKFVRLTTTRQAWKTRSKEIKQGGEELDDEIIEGQEEPGASGEQETDLDNTQKELEEIISRCLRSENRKKVIIDSLLRNRSVKEIADEMGKTANAIYVLKNKGIEQLRGCNELKEYQKKMQSTQKPDKDELSKAVQHFLNVIDGVADSMSCEECRSWLPEYVEAEVSGYAVVERFPEVKRHLDLCRSCEREYVALLESTLDEMAEGLPDVDAPPADLSFLPPVTFRTYVKVLIEDVIRQQLPGHIHGLENRLDLFLRRMEAFGERPLPRAVPVMGDYTLEQLHLATYDVVRSVLQELDARGPGEPIERAELIRLVESAAERAAEHQGLAAEKRVEFTRTVTERICGTPALLQRIQR
jgi:RNA polymerase sigma factor (sigma-70 family)